jgi:hypothetical protein
MKFLGSIGKRLRLRPSQKAIARRFQSYVDPKLVEYSGGRLGFGQMTSLDSTRIFRHNSPRKSVGSAFTTSLTGLPNAEN